MANLECDEVLEDELEEGHGPAYSWQDYHQRMQTLRDLVAEAKELCGGSFEWVPYFVSAETEVPRWMTIHLTSMLDISRGLESGDDCRVRSALGLGLGLGLGVRVGPGEAVMATLRGNIEDVTTLVGTVRHIAARYPDQIQAAIHAGATALQAGILPSWTHFWNSDLGFGLI